MGSDGSGMRPAELAAPATTAEETLKNYPHIRARTTQSDTAHKTLTACIAHEKGAGITLVWRYFENTSVQHKAGERHELHFSPGWYLCAISGQIMYEVCDRKSEEHIHYDDTINARTPSAELSH